MAVAETKKWLKIGEVARQLNIAVETIRMYEREGIFLAEKTASGQRVYNEADVQWLRCIRQLIKVKGLNIEGIRRLLALIPCWAMKPCTPDERENCPAYLTGERPCWMDKAQLAGNCTTENCRACTVYQAAINCTNIKLLLHQSQGRQV